MENKVYEIPNTMTLNIKEKISFIKEVIRFVMFFQGVKIQKAPLTLLALMVIRDNPFSNQSEDFYCEFMGIDKNNLGVKQSYLRKNGLINLDTLSKSVQGIKVLLENDYNYFKFNVGICLEKDLVENH